jgi:hypothetical protein
MSSYSVVYLVNEEKHRIHKAIRRGTRGRQVTPHPRCQIYPMYLDRYKVLPDLYVITGIKHPVKLDKLSSYSACKHCWDALPSVA